LINDIPGSKFLLLETNMGDFGLHDRLMRTMAAEQSSIMGSSAESLVRLFRPLCHRKKTMWHGKGTRREEKKKVVKLRVRMMRLAFCFP
jgi:hypothetical protein